MKKTFLLAYGKGYQLSSFHILFPFHSRTVLICNFFNENFTAKVVPHDLILYCSSYT